jgi:hypothetical protein
MFGARGYTYILILIAVMGFVISPSKSFAQVLIDTNDVLEEIIVLPSGGYMAVMGMGTGYAIIMMVPGDSSLCTTMMSAGWEQKLGNEVYGVGLLIPGAAESTVLVGLKSDVRDMLVQVAGDELPNGIESFPLPVAAVAEACAKVDDVEADEDMKAAFGSSAFGIGILMHNPLNGLMGGGD